MRPRFIDTNTLADTQSPTGATGLDSLMDLAVLFLQWSLIYFPYRKYAQMRKVQQSKIFDITTLVAMY